MDAGIRELGGFILLVLSLSFPSFLSAAHVVHVTPQHYDHPLDRGPAARPTTAPHSLPYLVCAEPRLLRFARPVRPTLPLPDLTNATLPPIDTGVAPKPTPAPPPPPRVPPPLPRLHHKPTTSPPLPPPPQPQPLILGDDLRRDYLHEDILPYFRAPYLVIPPPPPLPTSKATYQQQ
ncbi:hypothetical protein Ga0100231_020265 [Opitutaceae bacterium TAV4]|nr:hypothetical protein Ga0100231_020265 [Opitutaceae bacterium TAV4]